MNISNFVKLVINAYENIPTGIARCHYCWLWSYFLFVSTVTVQINQSWDFFWSLYSRSGMIVWEKRPNPEYFSGPYFPAFGLNTDMEIYEVNLPIFPDAEKKQTRKLPVFDTFHAVIRAIASVFTYLFHMWKYINLIKSRVF